MSADVVMADVPDCKSSSSSHLRQQPIVPLQTPVANMETVPVAFKWTHGAREVYVTGSFDNWQSKVRMSRSETGEFVLTIDIPHGEYFFK